MDIQERAYFFCLPLGPPEVAHYQHSCILLAEGLKALGIPVFSNLNYWQLTPDNDEFLFTHDPAVRPEHCTLVIFDPGWLYLGYGLPEDLFQKERHYLTICLDNADERNSQERHPQLRDLDFYFVTHYNRLCKYPAHVWPWTFGLTNRILNEIESIPPFENRQKTVLWNARVHHPLRQIALQKVRPLLAYTLTGDDTTDSSDDPPQSSYHHLMWHQTGRRHYPAYYQRLKRATACACFGGRFFCWWPHDQKLTSNCFLEMLSWVDPRRKRILQWDSWRFLEAMAAGCVAIHADFELYGMEWPVMPVNMKHYIGVDFRHPNNTLDRIQQEPDLLREISDGGRSWALKHYRPISVARYFLQVVREQGKVRKRAEMQQ